jgi:hypothetical protein
MGFDTTWKYLLNAVEGLPQDTTFITPLAKKSFYIIDISNKKFKIKYQKNSQVEDLEYKKFDKLINNIKDARGEFDLDRLPPNAEPYATVLSIHPVFEFNEQDKTLSKSDSDAETQIPSSLIKPPVSGDGKSGEQSRSPSPGMMIENMGSPPNKVECPIEGCQYSHRSASTVARHVSGSSTAKHIWAHTEYHGWKDFVRSHGESPE